MPDDWHLRAACRGMDPRLFFPERGEPVGRALAVCARCEVREECLDEALTEAELLGVWGGTTAPQRKALRRGLRVSA